MVARSSATSSSAEKAPAKLYFGYGSNLWIQQMHSRCPDSHYVGISRLSGYQWIINNRGYANIIETRNGTDEVWGLVFFLTPSDEARLDRNEGVPYAYTKETLRVDFWPHQLHQLKQKIDIHETPVVTDVLVYIDRERLGADKPRAEYVVRMNHGIEDGVEFGLPEAYVRDVVRKFIPEIGEVDSKVTYRAEQQAMDFRDELESE